jgi:plastocyanin
MTNLKKNHGLSTALILVIGALVIGGVVLVASMSQESEPEAANSSASSSADITAEESTDEGRTNDSPQAGSGQSAETETEADDKEEELPKAVVTYTDSGFSPESITVSAGQTVRFENEAKAQMWVASDVHPSHSQYDGTSLREHCDGDGISFDQCEGGDGYSFTFGEAGEYDYHNHLRASDGASVIVR